jgi:hypothetical protein
MVLKSPEQACPPERSPIKFIGIWPGGGVKGSMEKEREIIERKLRRENEH